MYKVIEKIDTGRNAGYQDKCENVAGIGVYYLIEQTGPFLMGK